MSQQNCHKNRMRRRRARAKMDRWTFIRVQEIMASVLRHIHFGENNGP